MAKPTQPRIDLALIHNGVYNKQGKRVTTCITGFDLHDIARTAQTYGVGYYLVNALPAQQAFAQRVLDFWKNEAGMAYNRTRAAAIRPIRMKRWLSDVTQEIVQETGTMPTIIATSAKTGSLPYATLRDRMAVSDHPILLLFGTGWGLSPEILAQAEETLSPIQGPSNYNHLSVRSAVAIILDRLFGKHDTETEKKGENNYVTHSHA